MVKALVNAIKKYGTLLKHGCCNLLCIAAILLLILFFLRGGGGGARISILMANTSCETKTERIWEGGRGGGFPIISYWEEGGKLKGR